MALTFQQQQLKQGQYHGQLRSAKTQAEVNSILAAAKREGVALDASVIKSREQAIKSLAEKNTRAKAAQDLVNKQTADKAAADKAAQEAKLKTQQQQQAAAIKATADKLKAQYSTELKTADTTQQINSILDKAKTNGVTLDAATVTTATNRAKVADFNQSLRSATTLKQINDLVAKANADKIGYDVQQVNSIKEPLIQQAQNKYQQQLAKAASIQDVNTIAKQAQAELGRSLDPASIATQTQNIIQGYTNQIKSAKTIDELTTLNQKIQSDGANLDPKIFGDAKTTLDVASKKALADAQKAIADQQAQIKAAQAAQAGQVRNNFITNVINKNTATQAQVDEYIKAMTDLGQKPDDNLVQRAQSYVTAAARAPILKQIQGLNNEITRGINDQSLTKTQIADIVGRAEKLGEPLNAAMLDRANTFAQQFLNNNYTKQIYNAQTQSEIDTIVAQAKTEGATISPATLDSTTKNVAAYKARADDIAKFIVNKKDMPGLPQGARAPNGISLYSIPPDEKTGYAGGWFSFDSGNNTWRELGKNGQPTGNRVSQKELDLRSNQVGYNQAVKYGDTGAAQGYALKMGDVASWEANLPSVRDTNYDYRKMMSSRVEDPSYGGPGADPLAGKRAATGQFVVTGPDGSIYQYVNANFTTGQPGQWLKSTTPGNYRDVTYRPLGNETATVLRNDEVVGLNNSAVRDNIKVVDIQSGKINAAYREKVRAAREAADKAGGYNFFGSLGLKFVDDFVEDTIGWGTIATIAGGMIGGPWGAAMANAAVGVVENRSLEDVIKGAALTFAMAYGTQALTRAIGETVAQGVNTGVIDATDDILSFSDNIGTLDEAAGVFDQTAGLGELPQGVIDQAMATSDPVAALKCGQWLWRCGSWLFGKHWCWRRPAGRGRCTQHSQRGHRWQWL
jgi:hypothetical protein